MEKDGLGSIREESRGFDVEIGGWVGVWSLQTRRVCAQRGGEGERL